MAGVIWSMASWLPGKATPVAFYEPQPHDEPYTSFEFRRPALEQLPEYYAHDEVDPLSLERVEVAPGTRSHDDEHQFP